MDHKWSWLEEICAFLIVAIPAATASFGVILLLKTTCGFLWHSSCQLRISSGIRHIEEITLVSEVKHNPEIIWPRKKASKLWGLSEDSVPFVPVALPGSP